VLETVPLDAYADGGAHTVEFHSQIFAVNGAGSNFFVDDVSLDDTLPVELTSFTATLDQNTIVLKWATASEDQNAGFEVQHAPSAQPFRTVGFVEGAGTTSQARTYRYEIAELTPGPHAFRLKQVDYDGSFDVSPVIEAILTVPDRLFLGEVYPNPFNPNATVRFAVPVDQHVDIGMYDVTGRLVRTLFDAVATANTPYAIRINGSGLPTGQYILRASGVSGMETKVVSLLK
jgi:hypothetical protein